MLRRACIGAPIGRQTAGAFASTVTTAAGLRFKSTKKAPGSYLGPSLEVFYDGGCPLCRREIDQCLKWDEERNSVLFTDISDPAFDAKKETKLPLCVLEDRIHARDLMKADREMIDGMEVFRRMYFHMGWDSRYSPPTPKVAPRILGGFFALTGLPVVRCITDQLYNLWACFRLWNRDRKIKNDSSKTGSKSSTGTNKCATGRCGL
jgi:predicted DCC family thiol-disulfide oxidoreductase YuxK